jgi:hypothetical protein
MVLLLQISVQMSVLILLVWLLLYTNFSNVWDSLSVCKMFWMTLGSCTPKGLCLENNLSRIQIYLKMLNNHQCQWHKCSTKSNAWLWNGDCIFNFWNQNIDLSHTCYKSVNLLTVTNFANLYPTGYSLSA